MVASGVLRIVLAALVLLGGVIHLHQFIDGFSSIPIIGPMFVANALASVTVAALLIWRRESLFVVAGGLIAGGSLMALFISRGPGLFGYVSTSFKAAEILIVMVEVLAVVVAAGILVREPKAATIP